MIPAGFGQALFSYQGAAHPTGAAWTIGFEQPAVTSPTQLAVALAGAELDHLAAMRHDTSVLVEVLVKYGPDDVGPSGSATVNVQGLLTGGESVEPNTAMLVKKTTNLGGRANRGRLYFPGADDGTFDGSGLISVGTLSAFQAAWDDFFAEMQGLNAEPVILHAGAGTPTPVTGLVLDARAATQRRRLRR